MNIKTALCKLTYCWTITLAIMSLLGCQPKPVGNTDITIQVTWGEEFVPQTIKYHVYDEKGQQIDSLSGESSPEGFFLRMKQGTYSVLVYNPDAEGIERTETENYKRTRVKALPHESGTGIIPVKNVYYAKIDELVVGADPKTIAIMPRRMEKQMTINVTPKNIPGIAAMQYNVSGIVSEVLQWNESPIMESESILVGQLQNKEMKSETNQYTGAIHFFECCSKNLFTIEILLEDGTTDVSIPIDLSEKLANPEETEPIEVNVHTQTGAVIFLKLTVKDWIKGGTWDFEIIK